MLDNICVCSVCLMVCHLTDVLNVATLNKCKLEICVVSLLPPLSCFISSSVQLPVRDEDLRQFSAV